MIKKILCAMTFMVCAYTHANAQLLKSANTAVETKAGMQAELSAKHDGGKDISQQTSDADNSNCFEGEIAFETFENYCKWMNKMPNSIFVDGVHKMRLIVKGDKMHLIDETTQCHTVINGSYTHYCDITKTGFNMEKYDFILAAAPRTLDYGVGGQIAELTANTFAKTEQTTTLLDNECTLWQGDIVHNMGGMSQKYSCHAYCTDIQAPSAYPIHLSGMPLNYIAAKWIMKYDGGNVGALGVGELSFYQEGDVTSITPRSVSDEEFVLPAAYKITKGSIKSPFKMMNYYKGVKKALEKAGIKGADKSAKSTGVHFKTQEEWDF